MRTSEIWSFLITKQHFIPDKKDHSWSYVQDATLKLLEGSLTGNYSQATGTEIFVPNSFPQDLLYFWKYGRNLLCKVNSMELGRQPQMVHQTILGQLVKYVEDKEALA